MNKESKEVEYVKIMILSSLEDMEYADQGNLYRAILSFCSIAKEALRLKEDEGEELLKSIFSSARKLAILMEERKISKYERGVFMGGLITLLNHPDKNIRLEAIEIMAKMVEIRQIQIWTKD